MRTIRGKLGLCNLEKSFLFFQVVLNIDNILLRGQYSYRYVGLKHLKFNQIHKSYIFETLKGINFRIVEFLLTSLCPLSQLAH